MDKQQPHAKADVLAPLGGLPPDLETFYKDVHAQSELSMQENRTAGKAAARLQAAGFGVTAEVMHTGVVGLLRNGDQQRGEDRAGDACLRP